MNMRRNLFLLLFFYFFKNSMQIGSLTSSIAQIVREFFVNRSENFDLIVFENKTQSLSGSVIEVIKLSQYPTKIIQISNQQTKIELNQSAILLFETANSFEYFLNNSILYHNFSKNFHFLVYVDDHLNFEPILSLNYPFLLHSSFIFKNYNHDIKFILYGFNAFRSINCKELRMKIVNKFKMSNEKWEHSKFFLENISDLEGCELIIAFRFPEPLIYYMDSDGNFRGYGTTLINEIGKSLNFKCNYIPHQIQKMSRNPLNKSHIDIFIFASSQRHVEALKSVNLLRNTYEISSQIYSTQAFTVVDMIVVTSKPAPYTQFEKVLLPFESEVWFWIIITVALAVLVIIVVKLCPKNSKNFVFGSLVKTPGLNLL